MKRILLLSLMLLTGGMAHAVTNIVCFNAQATPVTVTQALLNGSGDSSQFSQTSCDFDPVIPSTPQAYWKRQSPGLWVAWTAQEIAAKATFDLAQSTASNVNGALTSILSDPEQKILWASVFRTVVIELRALGSTVTFNNFSNKVLREINPP